jgi:alginate O-acetyltransferase complex protein AlgI
MIFTQPVFLLFFLVAFSVFWALKTNGTRKIWLCLASYFFYGYWDYRFLALILFCTVFDFLTARALERQTDESRRKLFITLSITVNLAVLGFFKYFNFFVDSAVAALEAFGWTGSAPTLRILLPVGISFFTFQSMSYTVDVYRRQIPAQKNFLDFATFVAFFPQLVAGPIVRARDFLPQLAAMKRFDEIDVRRALVLFAVGYFKKACVADNVSAAIDPLFADPERYDAVSRVLGAALYSLQIFCDFSGYTDMAMGVAALFGYFLAKNFDAPYFAKSIQEFWQRWHISLSTWLRDYLYIPLGGNRGSAFRASRNLMLTMLLGGLWHGANWTFIIWGALHGLALVLHRYVLRKWGGAEPNVAYQLFGWAVTLGWVVFCFTIFRLPNIEVAFTYFTAAPERSAVTLWRGWWTILVCLGAVQYFARVHRAWLIERVHSVHDYWFYGAIGFACAGLLCLTPTNMAPFIYFQF